MTIKRLAEITKTSPGTVSKAFSGSAEISAETKEAIFRAAREEGCFEKYYKGPREKKLVAILCPEAGSEYYGRLVDLLTENLRRRDCNTVIAITAFDSEREALLFSELTGRVRVDGVICLGSGDQIRNPDQVPLVLLGRSKASREGDAVQFLTEEAVRSAIFHLKECGHKRIAFLGEQRTQAKLKLFCNTMREAGLAVRKEHLITVSGRFGEGGYAAMRDLLDRGDPPTAVMVAYDSMALGAMRCAKDAGFLVPEDISFIGMDDINMDAYLDVSLSSIHTHLEEACDKVMDLLLYKMKNRHYKERRLLTVRAELCLRESVADLTKK